MGVVATLYVIPWILPGLYRPVEPEAAPVPDSGCSSCTTGAVVWPSAVCRASCLNASEWRSNRTVIAGEHCGGMCFELVGCPAARSAVADSPELQVMPVKKDMGKPYESQ